MKILLCFVASLATIALARKGFGPTEQEWGFITVRPGADMFWWLHQTRAEVDNYTERPLVIWLQGGPGSSSTGFGNFAEIGPLDADLKDRETSWINDVNVLFVDNPVGTGYSTVSGSGNFATTNRQIAQDFLVFMKGFYETIPELKSTPLYIFCESYGGKMTAEIALVLDQAIKAGELETTLVGVGLGDSWISPIDSVLTWAPYLLNIGAVDQTGYEAIKDAAEQTKAALDQSDFNGATDLWGYTEQIVLAYTNSIDFYNILTKIPFGWKKDRSGIQKPAARDDVDDKIFTLMNNEVKEALGINGTWGYDSGIVFSSLSEDFMKPVTNIVEELLNTTDIKVAVYNGQLDLIVDTPGTIKWVDELKYPESDAWKKAEREPLVVDAIIEGYYKKAGNLAFYWVDRAGHMVPSDNPAAMHYILQDVTDKFKGKSTL